LEIGDEALIVNCGEIVIAVN